MKDMLKVYVPIALVALIAIIIALRLVDPPPPREVVFAAGSKEGAYYGLAERYRSYLLEHDIEVEILETAGSVENLRLLRGEEAQIALVQGGLAGLDDAQDIQSLSGLFHEPFWVFVRSELGIEDFGALKPLRIANGGDGSGTRAMAEHMKAFWGDGWAASDPRSGQDAADALLNGDVDAAVFAASINASYIQRLLREESVELLPFDKAPAISRRSGALDQVMLLRGIADVANEIPSENIPLVAAVAQLAVDEDLHPAIQSLLLEAAADIHSGSSAFARSGAFPDKNATDLPLSGEAERYYRNGPTFLRRYFSFRTANFLERAWVLIIPLITLLIPLIRVAPPIYRWRVRRKIYVWYSSLRDIENKGRAADTRRELNDAIEEVLELQQEAGNLKVPLSYTEELYHLRSHIAFVRQLLEDIKDGKRRPDSSAQAPA